MFGEIFKNLICMSPGYLQDFIGNFYLRYGLPLSLGPLKYKRYYHSLKASQWLPRSKLDEHQSERLLLLIRHAYKNVPYYNTLLKKLKLNPDDFRGIRDLRKLPVLSKEAVVQNLDRLLSKESRKKYLKTVSTSGSTGKPMRFFRDKRYEFIELAHLQRIFDEINIKMQDKHIYLWSRPFIEQGIKDICINDPHLKRLSLSAVPQDLSARRRCLELIKDFNPVFVQGNPSMLYNLACFAQENNINDTVFGYFINYFENLFPHQREIIEKQFKCRIFNCYLSEERAVSAFECRSHEGMHIETERGILEILNDDGEVLADRCTGRVVATGLNNFAMPLIRYDIGDIASISPQPCRCGRGLPLLKSFDGRANETVKHKGKIVYSTTLSVLVWNFKTIKECQFVQEREEELKVNIVKRSGFSEKDAQGLIQTLQGMIGRNLKVTLNFVDHISCTRMGKFPFVVSKV